MFKYFDNSDYIYHIKINIRDAGIVYVNCYYYGCNEDEFISDVQYIYDMMDAIHDECCNLEILEINNTSKSTIKLKKNALFIEGLIELYLNNIEYDFYILPDSLHILLLNNINITTLCYGYHCPDNINLTRCKSTIPLALSSFINLDKYNISDCQIPAIYYD